MGDETRGGLRSDQLSGLLLLALAFYVGWENRAYPIGTLQEPGPATFRCCWRCSLAPRDC
jgi:hypothetical protein